MSCLVTTITISLLFSYCSLQFDLLKIARSSTWKLNITTQVYELNGKPPLWLYWNDLAVMPPHICLSLKTIHCHNRQDLSLRLITKTTVKQYIADIHPAFEVLIPAHQADYIRCRLLDMFGGMYIDIDAVALRSLKVWYDYLVKYDIVGYSWLPDGDKIGIGSLGPVRVHHPLFHQYKNMSHTILNKKFINTTKTDVLGWAEILRQLIVPKFHELLKNNQTHSLMFDGPSTVGQIATRNPMEEVNEAAIQSLTTTFPYLIYSNSGIRRVESEQQILNSNTLLERLFRIALDEKKCGVLPNCNELQRLYS